MASAYTYPKAGATDGGYIDILFQCHNIQDWGLGEPSKSLNMALEIKRDEFILRVNSDANLISNRDTVKRD